MVDFIFRSQKQYWSALKNLRKNLNNDTPEGKKARASFYSLTSDKKYLERNFKKRDQQDKKYSMKEIRDNYSAIRKDQLSKLKSQWKEMQNAFPNEKISWKEFQEINKEPDYDAIRESYTSPK